MRRFRDHARFWPGMLLATSVCCWLPTSVARAEPRAVPVSLDLSSTAEAEACINEAKFRRRIEDRLRRSLSPADQASLHIKVTVFQGAGEGINGFRARLVIRDNKGVVGEREFVDANRPCGTLLETLVLAVTLMIDPDGELNSADDTGSGRRGSGAQPNGSAGAGAKEPNDGTPSPTPDTDRSQPGPTATAASATPATSAATKVAPPPASTPAAKPKAASAPKPALAAAEVQPAPAKPKLAENSETPSGRAAADGTWGLRLFGDTRHAVLPKFSWGGGAGFVLFPASLGVEIAGALWPSATVEQGRFSVALSYLEGALQLCPPFLAGQRWRWAACLELQVGSLHAVGAGLDQPSDDRSLVAQVGGGLELSALLLGLGQTAATWGFLRLSGLVPFVRPQVVYFEGPSKVVLYAAPTVGGSLDAGFRFEFR